LVIEYAKRALNPHVAAISVFSATSQLKEASSGSLVGHPDHVYSDLSIIFCDFSCVCNHIMRSLAAIWMRQIDSAVAGGPSKQQNIKNLLSFLRRSVQEKQAKDCGTNVPGRMG
jgi:hypothetical protein